MKELRLILLSIKHTAAALVAPHFRSLHCSAQVGTDQKIKWMRNGQADLSCTGCALRSRVGLVVVELLHFYLSFVTTTNRISCSYLQ